jgi:hypothetical protein
MRNGILKDAALIIPKQKIIVNVTSGCFIAQKMILLVFHIYN